MESPTRKLLVWLRLFRPTIHGLIILGCFYSMYLLRGHTDLIPFVQLRIPLIDLRETMIFAGITVVLFWLIAMAQWVYDLFKPSHAYYIKFIKSWMLRVILSSFIAFFWFGYIFTNWISRFILLWWWILSGVMITVIDMFYNGRQGYLESKTPYRVLLLSSDSSVADTITNAMMQYPIYEVDRISLTQRDSHASEWYEIVMVAGAVDKWLLQKIADSARIMGQSFYHAGDTLFLEDLISKPRRLGPLMMLEYKSSPLEGRWRVVKRLCDIAISCFVLIIFSPLLLLIALLIKIDSSGPVIYHQDRIGKNKIPFTFVKFRSMYTHLSTGENYGGKSARNYEKKLEQSADNVRKWILTKIQHDPRVTPVGRFLRKTSLDELPSLVNVLVWNMSLIGPRPHLPHEVDQYDSWQERLFSVKPWITWYAQVFGRDELPFDEEAELDLRYIQNRSVALDLYVLVRTFTVVLRGK